jgi:CRP-like cAMP-binding protein
MNKSRTSSLKDEAQRALSRGDWKKALDLFQRHCGLTPGDLRSRLKVAELLERVGERSKAIQEYRKVAESYFAEGFLLKAISIHKVVLRMDPSDEGTEKHLRTLYEARAEETKILQPFLHLPFFSELHERERELLVQHVHVRLYEKDSLILQEGEEGDSLLIVARGEVLVSKQKAKEKEVPLGSLGAGDVLGEFGLLVDRKRHATVRTLTACEILEISKKKLEEIAEHHPRIKEVLSRVFKKRVFDTFLALSPLFSSLDSAQREEIMDRFRLLKVAGDTVLFQGGDPPDFFYIVKTGEVEIFIQARGARKVRLGTLRSGQFFGEIGVLLDKPRMAFAQTTQASELLALSKGELEKCLVQFPVLKLNLKKISSDRLGMIKDILAGKGKKQAREVRE